MCPNGLRLIQFACSIEQNANRVETRSAQHKLGSFIYLGRVVLISY